MFGGPHMSKARCSKLFREITHDSPDIVALQEVRFRNNALHNQKAWIARLLPDYLPFSANKENPDDFFLVHRDVS